VVSPRPDRAADVGGGARRTAIDLRATRPTRPANDNTAGLALRLYRVLPLVAALLVLVLLWNLLP